GVMVRHGSGSSVPKARAATVSASPFNADDIKANSQISDTQLSDVVSKSIFDIAQLMEATVHQCLESRLGSWASDGGHARRPLGSDFCVGRQACDIDQVFGLRDGLSVKRSNPYRQ